MHGLENFGGRALNSLRLKKSFGNWAREFRPMYGPYEAGLGRFVHLDQPEFIGGAAAAAEKASGGVRELVTLAVDVQDADAIGDEPNLARRQSRRLGYRGWFWPQRERVDCARLRRRRGGGGDEWLPSRQ